MNFCAEWLNHLLQAINRECDSKECLFEECACFHYQINEMDKVLEKYVGNLPEFILFLEKEWGWIIKVSENESKLIVDENKDYSVCPIAKDLHGKVSPSLCSCSEKFAEKMFSKVCKKKVTAKVKRSVIHDGKSCIYEISVL